MFQQIMVHHQEVISVHAAYSILPCIYRRLAANNMWLELVYRNFSSWFKRWWVAAFIVLQRCWLLPFILIDMYLGVRLFFLHVLLYHIAALQFFFLCFCIDMFVLPVGNWQTLHSLNRASW